MALGMLSTRPEEKFMSQRRLIHVAFLLLIAIAIERFGASHVLAQQPSVQQINDAFVRQIAAKIAGHENEPASQVFKNVKYLAATKASTLLIIMNVGYSKALGVRCTHCHNEADFSSDEKRPKQAAREMQVMHRGINEQLGKMEHLTQPV